MTKEGFAQILVPVATYNKLKTVATANRLSLGKTITKLLENNGIDTGIDTPISKPIIQNLRQPSRCQIHPEQDPFAEREVIETAGVYMAGPEGFEPPTSGSEGLCRSLSSAS